jgi:hypothetical protein
MQSVKISLCGALVALTVGSCGNPLDSFDGFCDAFAGQLCKQLAACPSVVQPAGDCTQSISGQICYCGMNAIASGTEKYHPEKAQACLDALKGLTSCTTVSQDSSPPACSLVYGLASGVPPQCPVIVGPLPDGSGNNTD